MRVRPVRVWPPGEAPSRAGFPAPPTPSLLREGGREAPVRFWRAAVRGLSGRGPGGRSGGIGRVLFNRTIAPAQAEQGEVAALM